MVASSVICDKQTNVSLVMPFDYHDACFVCPFHELACLQLGISESVREVPPDAKARPTQVRACLKQGFRQMHWREQVVGGHVVVLVEVVGHRAHHNRVAKVEVRLLVVPIAAAVHVERDAVTRV